MRGLLNRISGVTIESFVIKPYSTAVRIIVMGTDELDVA